LFSGLRYDHFSDVKASLSPRLGAHYQAVNDRFDITATWGEARKAPSFYALGDPLVGNPELVPEDSKGFDVRINIPLRDDDFLLSITGFSNTYSNLIDFDFATFQLVNRSSADTTGFEVQLQGGLGNQTTWSLFLATLNNEVDGVDNALLHRPERSAGGYISWRPSGAKWTVTTSATYEGKRQSSSIPGGTESLGSYSRFNLALGRDLSNNLGLRIAVDNLFDSDFESVAGFPAPGRQYRIGLHQSF
jgi:outer membrane cobalamin receptor